MIYIKKYFLVFLFLFLITISVFAREITIFVRDSDLNIPLEGAVIRTREGAVYSSDKEGKAVIEVPDNRQTIINAAYPGYETGTLTIPVTGNSFTLSLHLSGVIQGRELIIEAAKPEANESRTGRSIAVSEREIAQTSEIGFIEDVMNTIKLLPGVSYTGFSSSQPSIRGGYPGDMSASLNGFYINNPFFWGGAFSIFDPRMVQSAQLSHGVFSSRYGHTISGLLEITSKNPSPTETLFEFSVNTSTTNFNLSVPILGNGGILIMGRTTYYDPIFALAGELSSVIPELAIIESFKTVPYIRTLTANGNYRFAHNVELTATAFFGMDGAAVGFNNSSIVNNILNSETTIDFDFSNYQAFLTSTLSWNPRSDMLLRFLIGAGYEDQVIYGDIKYNINRNFTEKFKERHTDLYNYINSRNLDPYNFKDSGHIDQTESNLNLQGRIDYDWEISDKIILSSGIQAMYNFFDTSGIQSMSNEIRLSSLNTPEELILKQKLIDQILYNNPGLTEADLPKSLRVIIPNSWYPNAENNLLSTSGYILGVFTPISRLTIELGLRMDHFSLYGNNNFSLSTDPVLNPRLNAEINLLNGSAFFRKIDLSIGTGLFSSINDNIFFAEEKYNVSKIKPNRAWTSVIGFKFEFPQMINLSIEGYYKYVYDRMYIPLETGSEEIDIRPNFDGEGMVWGIDVMLQKIQSRYWDGWIAYSYSWAKYRDPHGNLGGRGMSGGTHGDDWYYPQFHRFHTLNLILNFKPVQNINIYLRLGAASGVPLLRPSDEGPTSEPAYLVSDNVFIEKYYWTMYLDENNRTTPSLNMDVKLSIFGGNKTGKAKYEVYIAIENILGLVYTAQGNTSFNQYTGEIDQGSMSANYDMPIPLPSFGVKFSY